jgi:lipopolysaccharide export system permease protein
MTLHFYFASRFITRFLMTLLGFFAFQFTIDLVEQMRRLPDAPLSHSSALALLNTPWGLYQISPLIAMIAGLIAAMGLARSEEWVVTRAAGRSITTALLGPAIGFFGLCIVMVAIGNPIVAGASAEYEARRAPTGPNTQLSIGPDGLWLRQGGDTGIAVLRAGRSGGSASQLYDITVTKYDEMGRPDTRIEAATAKLEPGAWVLTGVQVWDLRSGQNPQSSKQELPQYRLSSPLTKERITESFSIPQMISIWSLPKFIAQLQQAGFSARTHLAWFWGEMTRPFFMLAMLLLGASFGLHHARVQRTSLRILMAFLAGFTMYYMRDFAYILAQGGQLPPALAGVVTAMAACFISVGFILQQEES